MPSSGVDVVDPGLGQLYPAAHIEQLAAPAELKVPGAQMAEAGVGDVDPAGQAYPALHALQTLDPVSEYCPAGQRTSVAEVVPFPAHTYPALQATQVDHPEALYWPGTQLPEQFAMVDPGLAPN